MTLTRAEVTELLEAANDPTYGGLLHETVADVRDLATTALGLMDLLDDAGALIRRLVNQHDDYHGDCTNDPAWTEARQ